MRPSAPGVEYTVVYNPVASRAESKEELARTLGRYLGPDNMVLVPTSGNQDADAVRFHQVITTDEVVTVGGDGAVHDTTAATRHPDAPKRLRQATHTVVPRGRKNDFAYMLGKHTGRLFRRSRKVGIKPLSYSITNDDGELLVSGEANYSFIPGGVGTEIAKQANDREHRAKVAEKRTAIGKWLVEARMAARAIQAAEPLPIAGHNLINLMYAKGPRMAGMLRFPVRLSKDEFFVCPTAPTRRSQIATILGRIVGVGAGFTVQEFGGYTGVHEIRLLEPVEAAVDGEIIKLPAGILRVGLAENATTFRTTKHQP